MAHRGPLLREATQVPDIMDNMVGSSIISSTIIRPCGLFNPGPLGHPGIRQPPAGPIVHNQPTVGIDLLSILRA